jgi:hypothetical protein
VAERPQGRCPVKGPVIRTLGVALAALALLLATQARAIGAEQAVWVKKKINFFYQGFTAKYSCDGLRDTVRSVLLQLGARKSGMDLMETGCSRGFNLPEPLPGVSGSFYVLEPVSKAAAAEGSPGSASKKGGAEQRPIEAEWQIVDVSIGPQGRDRSGVCELMTQVKQRILPLFAPREVKFETDCFPHQVTIGKTELQAQVLKPIAGENHDVARAMR